MFTTLELKQSFENSIDKPSMTSIIIDNIEYFKSKLRGHYFGNALTDHDILYETILRILVLEKKGNTSEIRNPKAYVSRVFYNVIAFHANQLKKSDSNQQFIVRMNDEILQKIENENVEMESTVSRIKYYTQADAMIQLAEETLKESRKDVFLSKTVDGLKLSQIAEKYGITPNNAKQLYNRAKKDLKKAISLKIQKEELYEQERI